MKRLTRWSRCLYVSPPPSKLRNSGMRETHQSSTIKGPNFSEICLIVCSAHVLLLMDVRGIHDVDRVSRAGQEVTPPVDRNATPG